MWVYRHHPSGVSAGSSSGVTSPGADKQTTYTDCADKKQEKSNHDNQKSPLDEDADKAVRKAAKAHASRGSAFLWNTPTSYMIDMSLAIMFCKGWLQPYRYIHEHRKELPWATLPLRIKESRSMAQLMR